MPSRRKTREFVLQVLYAADARKEDPLDVMEFLEKHYDGCDEDEVAVNKIVKDHALRIVTVVSEHSDIIDKLITKLSHNWKLYRIDRVDRNILRMAIAELAGTPDTPGRVILNEAIEIGKKYGSDHTPSFINGILDRLHAVIPRPSNRQELEEVLADLDKPKLG